MIALILISYRPGLHSCAALDLHVSRFDLKRLERIPGEVLALQVRG